MTHKLTAIAGFCTWIDGKVCFDALAMRPNEILTAKATTTP
jgi:hypothetical protein